VLTRFGNNFTGGNNGQNNFRFQPACSPILRGKKAPYAGTHKIAAPRLARDDPGVRQIR